jgi:hypothetical protein
LAFGNYITQGDSFFVTFPRANDTVAAAIDMQRGLDEYIGPQDTRLQVEDDEECALYKGSLGYQSPEMADG